MECPYCKNTELVRTGKYFGKNVTKQCYQCKECRSYFRVSLPHKGNEIVTNGLSGATQEE